VVVADIAGFIPPYHHFVTNIGNHCTASLVCLLNRRPIMIRSFMLLVLASGVTVIGAADQPGTSDPAPRVFTTAQARAGKVAYESSCGLCHQFNMQGRTGAPGELPDVNSLPENMIKTIDQNGEQVPPLVGPRFMAHWGAKSTQEYVARVANAMGAFPPKNVGEDTSLQLTAYFLQMNGAKPGKIALSAQTKVTLFAATGQAPQ
jgi:mono/diheme cytochrome c family protein